ncbi:hypothetical protein [uncultured Friedmanniella sp.]|uniref:hypothetical protein n=1 Tax=uncultured Friedmanniella sp. TaxID=335381 RepID=UPI0035CB15B9
MNQSDAVSGEHSSTTITGSTVTGSAFATGSRAHATATNSSGGGNQVEEAIARLRQALGDAQQTAGRRDDETREDIGLALGRLEALTDELRSAPPVRDWSRVKRLVSGIGAALTRLTSLTGDVDALRDAVERLIR